MYTIDFTFIPDWEDYEALINTPPPLENELPAFLPSLNSDHPLILLPPPSPPQTKERKRKIRYGHNTNELKCVAGSLIRRFKQQEALNKFKEEIGCTGKHICTKGYVQCFSAFLFLVLGDVSSCLYFLKVIDVLLERTSRIKEVMF